MGSKFFVTTIGEQLTLQRGFDITKNEQVDGRVPVVSSGGISSFHNEFKVKGPGVILGRKGSLGTVYYIEENFWPHDTTLWVKDFKGNNPRFVYYFFTMMADSLKKMDVGAANPSLNRNHIHPLPTKWPIKSVQDGIEEAISPIEEKINLNRQINQTLEQMAQTLFKSWFVDFDPVIDNALDAGSDIPDTLQERAEQRRLLRAKVDFKPLPAETRALFPSEFEETELGWVPKGWVYCRLVDIASISSGKRPPTKSDEKDGENFIPVWGGNGIKWFTNQYLFNNKYIITGRVGTLGTVYKVDGLSWPSDNALVINPHNKDCFEFIYQHLSNTDIESLNSGSTQPLVTQTALGNVDVLLPNGVDILSLFQCQTGMFDRKITENMLQIECLSSLRNELLPKLISGELALDDLPEYFAEAAEAL